MQTIARDLARLQLATSSNNSEPPPAIERQPITDEYVRFWLSELERCTNIFYNEANAQNPAIWQEAQAKLVQFQKIHDPFDLCIEIIKKSENPLVLYQATLCLKNAVANDFRKFDLEELFKLFQFLYEFLCSQALKNEMSVNETTALICAMIFKKIASERSKDLLSSIMTADYQAPSPQTGGKESDQITQVISALCSNLREPSYDLSKKIASALMLSSLLLECQMSTRSTLIGIRLWKLSNTRRLVEAHLKEITQVCLDTMNRLFSSSMLNPADSSRESQLLFHLVGSLIQCVEYALCFNSSDTGCTFAGGSVLRVFQCRTISALSQANEHDRRLKVLREWCEVVMTPTVVQFLFDLYATVKSMVNMTPGWNWPSNILKNCLNCLYFLSDIHNSINVEHNEKYVEFVGHLMLGAFKIIEADVNGVDDSYQVACLMTSISMHTSETRHVRFDTITSIKAEHFLPFLDAAKRFTCRIFTKIARTTKREEEEEEEKTVEALLDFWYHLLRNIESEIKWAVGTNTAPKITTDGMTAYARAIVESYISCHLHEPLGQLVPKIENEALELNIEQADEQDDNSVYGQQLVSFGGIARFDSLHTAKLLIELLSTKISEYETFLSQTIGSDPSPDGNKYWEYINDDLHWLLLMLQHFLTQTGYGEVGFMCNEILSASLAFEANLQKTLEAFEKCDYTSPEVDPIVRLIILCMRLCQIEMDLCMNGKCNWISSQTNSSLTTLLSRFCLTYLYPKETDYTIISEAVNYCFGQDSPTADKFLKFVCEHSCCLVPRMIKSDQQIVKKNVELLHILSVYQPNTKDILEECMDDPTSMIHYFFSGSHECSSNKFVNKLMMRFLSCHIFSDSEDLDAVVLRLRGFWEPYLSVNQNQRPTAISVDELLHVCEMTVGLCEACDDELSERVFEQVLVPVVKILPNVLRIFRDFENVAPAVFNVLYYIVKIPMVNIATWDSQAAKSFYDNCNAVVEVYAEIASCNRTRADEDDCEDIVAVLNFSHEVMKRDWGHSSASCESVVKLVIEKLAGILKPEFLQFPRIRLMYYRLLVYLVDDEDRLQNLSDQLLSTIVSSIVFALKSQFDKDVDNHVYTIIAVVCRVIYTEQGSPPSERLAKFMMPVLPTLFTETINQNTYTINTDTAEMVAPALFSLRCCFMDVYQNLVKNLIESQDDPFAQSKVRSLFENLESKIHKFTLSRTSCREFNSLFVPFLAELHNYVTVK